MTDDVTVRELVGWGLDESPYRPSSAAAEEVVMRAEINKGQRPDYIQRSPLVNPQSIDAAMALSGIMDRPDLHVEMRGLQWTVGIVDLRCLLAFQRRVLFDDTHQQPTIPIANDWTGLIALTFPLPVTPTCNVIISNNNHATLQSSNPNLRLRLTASSTAPALQLHAGSPFFEVAEYEGRWFLRDGYHRAYHLLRANITHVPAVVIRAATLAELGPTDPWFFPDEVLFGLKPPYVTDFMRQDVTAEYKRPRLSKTFHVTIDENLEPVSREVSRVTTMEVAETGGESDQTELSQSTSSSYQYERAPHAFGDAARAAVYRAIGERRDVRRGFLPDLLPADLLARLLAAAHSAPSVGLMQPTRFIVIKSPETRQQIYAAFCEANDQAAAIYTGERSKLYASLKLQGILEAPQNLCIVCDTQTTEGHGLGRQSIPETAIYSTVCAVENLWLAARAEGVGVGWVSIVFPHALRSILNIPPHIIPIAYLCLGYVEAFAERPELEQSGWERRLPLASVVSYETYEARKKP
jgi:5,6-dimethylbenzimidazole synthase